MEVEERVGSFINLLEHFQSRIGSFLEFTEFITDRDFDRHGTSCNSFCFVLSEVQTRISGQRITLLGKAKEQYEIGPMIIYCSITPGKTVVEELLGTSPLNKEIKRRTEIV